MFEKDYLMRLFTDLMNAINRILNSIDNDDIEGAKVQIQKSYGFLGNDSKFFIKTDVDDILDYLKTNDGNYLKRVEMLAELMYLDAKLQVDEEKRINIAKKTIQLQEHFIKNSKEYSFQLENKLKEMQNMLLED